jgi:hypothetical protein
MTFAVGAYWRSSQIVRLGCVWQVATFAIAPLSSLSVNGTGYFDLCPGFPCCGGAALNFEAFLMIGKPMYAKDLLSRYAAGQRDFRNLNLIAANLRNLNLSGANLSGTNLTKANLSGSNLSHANLSNTVLADTNLTNANLSQANLTDVDLSHVDLSKARLQGAILPQVSQP